MMLIEFRTTNFRSIKEECCLSLVANNDDDTLRHSNVFEPQLSTKPKNSISLLSSAVIYGANAAGKTNVLRAIREFKSIVTRCKYAVDKTICNQQFDAEKLVEFEIIFLIKGVRYQYGFSAMPDQIYDEWLFAFPKERPQTLFERSYDVINKKTKFTFNKILDIDSELIDSKNYDNCLFLSTCQISRRKHLKNAYDFILGINCVLRDLSRPGLRGMYPDSIEYKERINELIELLGSDKIDPLSNWNSTQFMSKWSPGEIKIFNIACRISQVLIRGCTITIDNLSDNLHSNVVKQLIEIFNNKKTNPKNAQLIFTTHDTSLMSAEVLRNDQIWFCNRNKNKETHLYSLNDFKKESLPTNIESAYLSGRFGAVQYIKPADNYNSSINSDTKQND